MIFLILLLLFLTACVSGTFVVNVTQTSYQAEENQNITLEWTFSTRRDTNFSSISTLCHLFNKKRISVLFELREGVETRVSQDPEFTVRLQWDKDVLTEGRITFHVSRLRTNDSGFYVCDIHTSDCWLNVTAAEELTPQRPSESPQPENSTAAEELTPQRPSESPQRPSSPQAESSTGVWVTVGVSAAVLASGSMAGIVLTRYKRRTPNAAIHTGNLSEEQTIQTYIYIYIHTESEHKVRPPNM
ncbi:uncharacterized protein [Pseudochaenichthys georgianus]|uniref:uncharacterized protein n=1 Tax=Pseudochaenichthys georgianus TaxID=52239 RepID=UPI001469A344|nr:uncharacterized protein LOC117444241 [Pseudochaenichthys georgianus]